MLVLSRKRDEAVIINGETTIYIVDIRGDKVRLGIETPVSHSVHRKEVYDALQKENEKYQKDMKSVELMFEENINGETELIRYGYPANQDTADGANKVRHILFRGTKASCMLYLDIIQRSATTLTAPVIS